MSLTRPRRCADGELGARRRARAGGGDAAPRDARAAGTDWERQRPPRRLYRAAGARHRDPPAPGRLAEWEKRVAALLAQQTALAAGAPPRPAAANTGGAAMVRFGERGSGERPPILAELALLQEAAADRATSLRDADSSAPPRRSSASRTSGARACALGAGGCSGARRPPDQARALGAAAEKRVDQLNDQLAEAFGLRESR